MVLGRSDIFLKLEIIKKTLKLLVILAAFRHGVFVFMAASAFALGPLSVLINSWPNRKLMGYTIVMQLMDVAPTALVCCAQAAVMLGVGIIFDATATWLVLPMSGAAYLAFLLAKLGLQGLFGTIIFIALSYIFRLNPMGEYARMAATAIKLRMPRLAGTLEKRFV